MKCIIDYISLLNSLWETIDSKQQQRQKTSILQLDHQTSTTNPLQTNDYNEEITSFIKHLEIYFLY
jgi:hypothetical protein